MPAPTDLPVLTDNVVTLRRWEPQDAGFLAEASADAAIQRYSLSTSRPLTIVEARQQLRERDAYRLTTDDMRRPSGSLVIADAVSGLPIGQCGIDGWTPGNTAQIGYWVAPNFRGRGLATRAVLTLTDWLFHLGASGVFLTIVEDNEASMTVAHRAGFRLDGPTCEATTWSGRPYEVLAFAVTRAGWTCDGLTSG